MCNSALIDNDPAYSVLKCVLRDEFMCSEGYFLNIVPENLKFHPLKGKTVCRKCNKECDGCYANGVRLNENCIRCKNYWSNSTNECVNNCSTYNEYLGESKVIIIKKTFYS